MKATKENPTLDIIRYVVTGVGILGIVVAITVSQLS